MFGKKEEKEKLILSEESAADQLQELYDYYDLDLTGLDEDAKKAITEQKPKLIRAIRKGRLEITKDAAGDIVITQTVGKTGSEKLEYNSEVAKALVNMKKYDTADTYGRIYAMLGSLAGISADAIKQLKGSDLAVAHSIGLTLIQAVN